MKHPFALIFTLLASPTFAADCTTTFDASCLSGEYQAQEVEAEQLDRARELDTFQQQAREAEDRELEEEAQAAKYEDDERRHQEQIDSRASLEWALRHPPTPEIRILLPDSSQRESFTIEPQWPVGIAPEGQPPGSFFNPYVLRGSAGSSYEVRPSFPFQEPGTLLNPYEVIPR